MADQDVPAVRSHFRNHQLRRFVGSIGFSTLREFKKIGLFIKDIGHEKRRYDTSLHHSHDINMSKNAESNSQVEKNSEFTHHHIIFYNEAHQCHKNWKIGYTKSCLKGEKEEYCNRSRQI